MLLFKTRKTAAVWIAGASMCGRYGGKEPGDAAFLVRARKDEYRQLTALAYRLLEGVSFDDLNCPCFKESLKQVLGQVVRFHESMYQQEAG